MNKEEVRQLESRLCELADYYGTRAPTAGAMAVWRDALGSVYFADLLSVFTDWPKRHARFPTADQVLKLAQERVSDRIEDEARRNRETAPKLEDLRRSESPMAEAFFRMHDAVYVRKVVEDPREWCKNVLKSDKTPDIWKRFAEASLELMPPEDDFTYEKKRDGKDWARRILACHEAGKTWFGTGQKVNFIQLKAARMALANAGELNEGEA